MKSLCLGFDRGAISFAAGRRSSRGSGYCPHFDGVREQSFLRTVLLGQRQSAIIQLRGKRILNQIAAGLRLIAARRGPRDH